MPSLESIFQSCYNSSTGRLRISITSLTSPEINGTITTTGLTMPAFTLGGTLTLNGYVINAGSGLLEIDTTGSEQGIYIKNTQDGAVGPEILMEHVTASPAVDDYVSIIVSRGRSDGAPQNTVNYSQLQTRIADPTKGSEDAYFLYNLSKAGTLSSVLKIGSTGVMDLVGGGSLQISSVQVVGTRVVDARCDDVINSGDATTDGVIDSLRDAMIAHGLISAA